MLEPLVFELLEAPVKCLRSNVEGQPLSLFSIDIRTTSGIPVIENYHQKDYIQYFEKFNKPFLNFGLLKLFGCIGLNESSDWSLMSSFNKHFFFKTMMNNIKTIIIMVITQIIMVRVIGLFEFAADEQSFSSEPSAQFSFPSQISVKAMHTSVCGHWKPFGQQFLSSD